MLLTRDQPNAHTRSYSFLLDRSLVCVEMFSWTELSSYPSERDDVESVLSAVDGVQEVAVGDLRTRKHLQLTADRKKRSRLLLKFTATVHLIC